MTTHNQISLTMLCLAFALGSLPACGPKDSQPVPAAEAKEANQTPADICETQASDPSTWQACTGQSVRFVGVVPKRVTAHPNAGAMGTQQSYLEVGDTQVVVSASKDPECAGERIIRGTLNRVDLGGAPGTRSSYQGWSITEATIRCK